MITSKQAYLIGKKLYVQTKNQNHCADWSMKNLDHAQASKILGKVLRVTYDLCMKNPTEASEITAWGRNEIKGMGYVEPQFNKSV